LHEALLNREKERVVSEVIMDLEGIIIRITIIIILKNLTSSLVVVITVLIQITPLIRVVDIIIKVIMKSIIPLKMTAIIKT
jgi:hypothetical protein